MSMSRPSTPSAPKQSLLLSFVLVLADPEGDAMLAPRKPLKVVNLPFDIMSGVGYRDLLRGRRWPAPGTLKLTARGTSLCLRSTHEKSNMLSGVKIHLSRQLRKVLGLSQKAQP